MASRYYTCRDCGKSRLESRFSTNTIRKYQQAVRSEANLQSGRARGWGPKNAGQNRGNANNGKAVAGPRCMDCTGGNVVELTCSRCDVTKRLEDFSKAQRRKPDDALCLNCSQEVQDLEPNHRDQVQEEITMERIRAGVATTNLMSGSTALGYGSNSRSMAYSNHISSSTHNDGVSDWINAPIPVPDDPRARSDAGSTRSSANIITGSGTGWENFPLENRRVSNSTSSRGGGGSAFVKQGAHKVDSVTKAQKALARTQLREREQSEQAALKDSDDDDDDSDDDPPY